MPSSIISIHEDSRNWEDMEKARFNEMIRHANTCHTTNMCSEPQKPQERQERWQDGHQALEQVVLPGGLWETQQNKLLYGQLDNQIMLGNGRSTGPSQRSSPSESQVGSGKRERSSHSSFSDAGSCGNAKHLDVSNSDE